MICLPKSEISLNIGHPRDKQALVRTPVPDAHLEHLIDYFADPELEQVMGWSMDTTNKDVGQFKKNISVCCHPDCSTGQHIIFGEYRSPDTMPVGYQVIKGVNPELGVAEYGNATLDPLLRSRGYGRLGMRTIMRYAFDQLGVKKFYGYILTSNQPQMLMTKKVGWQILEVTSWQMPDGTAEPMANVQITAADLVG